MGKQLGFYVNAERCIKCWACEVACKQWNNIPAGGVARRKVHEVTTGTFPNVKRSFVSLSCMHCADAPCAAVCPSGAITKRPEDGIVVVDKSKCFGCHYCFMACPFGIPQYTDEGMDKCDCCLGAGVAPGDAPHCVEACPMQCIEFGELDALGEDLGAAAAAGICSSGACGVANVRPQGSTPGAGAPGEGAQKITEADAKANAQAAPSAGAGSGGASAAPSGGGCG